MVLIKSEVFFFVRLKVNSSGAFIFDLMVRKIFEKMKEFNFILKLFIQNCFLFIQIYIYIYKELFTFKFKLLKKKKVLIIKVVAIFDDNKNK